MPTEYTAGILDGKTKDFKQFAKICSKAFLIHLREEPFDDEYKERVPTDYHTKAIAEAKQTLKDVEKLKDIDIIKNEKERLLKEIEYSKKQKVKKEENYFKMKSFLQKARNYEPPTEKHTGIAEFMIEQLTKTIDFDCKGYFYTEQIEKQKQQLKKINADDIRSDLKIQATKDIAYHTKKNEEEHKRCRETNKWYRDFIESLN